jgi:manganese/zinc/iron transport system permease protein
VSVLGGYALAVRADLTIAPVMALVAGVIFALALVLAPAQGMLARRRTRSEAAARTDLRSLLVHLASHGTDPSPIEHSRKALRDHLMWPEDRAARTILRGLDRGYLDRHGETLTLTDKGRAAALALEE